MLSAILAVGPGLRAEEYSAASPQLGAPSVGKGHEGKGVIKHKMTPEEREQKRAGRKEKFDSLPPEKQAEILKHKEEYRARREAMREKMKNMTPEEREKWRAEKKEKFDSLPPEKQAEIKKRMEERHARREAMREKMKNMTPQEREEWQKNHPRMPGGHGGGHDGSAGESPSGMKPSVTPEGAPPPVAPQ